MELGLPHWARLRGGALVLGKAEVTAATHGSTLWTVERRQGATSLRVTR